MAELKLRIRGRLIRSLLALREMLPGSLVETAVECGNPQCRCSKEGKLHSRFQLSLLLAGKPRSFHVPAEMVEEVGTKVQMHKKFQEIEARICDLNFQDFLQQKEDRKKKGK